jgi:hypothetical protein
MWMPHLQFLHNRDVGSRLKQGDVPRGNVRQSGNQFYPEGQPGLKPSQEHGLLLTERRRGRKRRKIW